MEITGIVRRMDGLGRIVIPIEMRRALQIREGDPLQILLSGGAIVLRKLGVDCVFCGGQDDLIPFREKMICPNCRQELRAL